MTKKKSNEDTTFKVETTEEFLARGGKITVLPPGPEPEEKFIIRSTSGGLPQLMSLPDGEHFFGETRRKQKKKVTKEEFTDKVSNSSLPPEVMASLMKTIGGKTSE
jgi:hypothetical protein